MSSITLTGSDFLTKGQFLQLDDGTLVLDGTANDDFDIGCVSKNVFSFSHNKSIVFTFKVDPYSEKIRKPVVWFNDNVTVYVNSNKELVLNGEKIADISTPNGIKGTSNKIGYLDGSVLTIRTVEENPKVDTYQDVVNFDLNDDAISYITYKDGKSSVNVVAEEGNPVLDIPDSVNNYKEDSQAPVKVAVGDKIAGALKGDGSVVLWGENAPSFDGYFTDIQIVEKNVYLLDTDGTLTKNGEFVADKIAAFRVSDNNDIAYITRDGLSNIFNGYPVEVFKHKDIFFAATRDGLIVTNVSELNNAMPFLKTNAINISNEYNLLNTKDGVVIAFGVQRADLDNDVPRYIDKTGATTPIINDANKTRTNFSWISENNKGFILAKHPKGKDIVFGMRGERLEPMVVDGGNVLPEEFLDFGESAYKLAVTFTPFGKSIRLFKQINGEFVNVKTNFLSVEENPFPTGRVSVYIKNATSFELQKVEITDELDTSLLPEEIIYRDVDTNVLQTKVAESLNEHTKTLGAVVDTMDNQASKIAELAKVVESKLKELDERVKELES